MFKFNLFVHYMKLLSALNGLTTVPHGITDIFHAYETDNVQNLYKVYATSVSLIPFSHMVTIKENIHVIDILFLVSAVAHFRHDMPKIQYKNKMIPREAISSLFVFGLPIMGWDVLTMYMVFIHVPRHYKKSWKYIKGSMIELICSILLLSIPGAFMMENVNGLPPIIKEFSEAIVIAHIIYNELYIDGMKEL